jgi:hypothetical protein
MNNDMNKSTKTNSQWYAYRDMGSYYKLDGGVLMQAYMKKDGNIDKVDDQVNGGEVDWNLLSGEYLDSSKKKLITDRLNEIVKELQEKH